MKMTQTLIWPALVLSASLLLHPQSALAADASQDKQQKLIQILESNAQPAEKAITCKKLAVYGGKEAVPALAALLGNKDLSSWARIALEAIPDPAADEALRNALGTVQGRQLVGVINSIGVRRDAKAIPGLTKAFMSADPAVASAAAVALGCIGGPEAGKFLEQSLADLRVPVRSSVAEGGVRCAERFLAEGKTAEAMKLYDLIRAADVPKQRKLEATRGAILARKGEGLPLLMEQLHSTDKAFFAIGLRTARELPGKEVTQAVAAEWEKADIDRKILLVMVLADRGDASVFSTIQKAAQSDNKKMRSAAITALERMATPACVPVLLTLATDADKELAQTAKASLVRLPGREINAEMITRLTAATGKERRVLIEVSGLRRVAEALPIVVRYAEDPDQGVRNAAITTISLLGEEKQAADLVKMLQKTQNAVDRENIEKALVGICGRRGAVCLPILMPLTQSPDKEIRMVALHTLSSIGGATALAAVKDAMTDKEESVQDEAIRTLSTWPDNWPDDTAVAGLLLDLAKNGKKEAHKVLGLRGYLQYVQVDKKLKNDDKTARIKELLPMITRPEEKRLAIMALSGVPTTASIEMLIGFSSAPAVAEEAFLAIISTADKAETGGVSKELRQKALQTVVDKTTVDRTRRKAQEALKRVGR